VRRSETWCFTALDNKVTGSRKAPLRVVTPDAIFTGKSYDVSRLVSARANLLFGTFSLCALAILLPSNCGHALCTRQMMREILSFFVLDDRR
jgi:hypothetical protein